MDNVEFDCSQRIESPRLSVANLMILTLFIAICMAVLRKVSVGREGPTGPGEFLRPAAIETMWYVIYGIFIGLSVGGATVLIAHGVSRKYFPIIEPGHWLLLSQATEILPLVGMAILFSSFDDWIPVYFTISIIAAMLQAGLLVVAICRRALPLHWKAAFALMLCGSGISVIIFGSTMLIFSNAATSSFGAAIGNIAQTLNILYVLRNPVIALALLSVTIVDCVKRQSYRWLHWLGLMLVGGNALCQSVLPWIAHLIF